MIRAVVIDDDKDTIQLFSDLLTSNGIKVVGKGGFGRVWKVFDKKTKSITALKVIDKARVITKKSVNSVMNERRLLAKM